MAIQWKDDLLIGVKEIDKQHKELFKRINDLLQAMREGKGEKVMEETFTFLQNYTKTHFKNEERLMNRFDYPEFETHRSYHEQYIKEVDKLHDKLQSQGPSTAIILELQRFLSNWWTNHIKSVDKKLGAFLQEQDYV